MFASANFAPETLTIDASSLYRNRRAVDPGRGPSTWRRRRPGRDQHPVAACQPDLAVGIAHQHVGESPGGFVAVIEMLAKNLDSASDGDELVLMKVTHIQVRGSREGTPNGLHSPAIRAANRLAKPRGERGERTKML